MDNWNNLIATFPESHILQSREWGQFKAGFGWQPIWKIWQDAHGKVVAAAQILQRTISLGGFADQLRLLYVPKGPLLMDWGDATLRHRVLDDLRTLARKQRAIFIKIDPDVRLGVGIPGEEDAREDPLGSIVEADLQQRGWCFSREQVQFRNTVLVDLTSPEEVLLARMKPKTRYNIRLASRKGLVVRQAQPHELSLLYRMYVETSLRDGFTIRHEAYYLTLWEMFMKAGMAVPLLAEVVNETTAEVEPVAGLVLFMFAGRAWYLHGMSRQVHRDKMPNHLLQWTAMRHAKASGCQLYDLWGAPDNFNEDDPMWGVFRFKEGLGGIVVRTIGAWDLPVRPLAYRLYVQILPRLLAVMRRRSKMQMMG